jgi:hypothetical protein
MRKSNQCHRPGQALKVPGGWSFQFSWQLAHEGSKVVSPTHWPPLPPGNIPGTHLFLSLIRPQGHSAPGRITSIKNFQWHYRTRDLPTCSAVPQPVALRRAPLQQYKLTEISSESEIQYVVKTSWETWHSYKIKQKSEVKRLPISLLS